VTAITTIDAKNPFRDILKRHIEVTRPAKFREPQHPVRHFILTKGPLCTDRARRLSSERLSHAKREIDAWIADGILSPSRSPYSSAMHMQRKMDGTWRICGDYRRLNRMTLPDKYPVPHLRDFTHRLHGCNIFSTLDLERAYFNIPMAPEDREKTALITPFGLFQFNVMPFGLAKRLRCSRFSDSWTTCCGA